MQFSPTRVRKHGFTLVDLLAGMAICVLLLAALVPAAGELDAVRVRAQCAANLKQIGAALATYANGNNGKLPRTRYDWDKADDVTAYTGAHAKDPFNDAAAPAINDVTAPLYLLLRTTNLKPDVFVCPGSKAKPLHFGAGGDSKATEMSNFPSEESLSYSLSNPYGSKNAVMMGWRWDINLAPDFPLVADMNPGGKAVLAVTPTSKGEELSKANSPNHQGAGQNVLYSDMHVAFEATPLCGPKDETTKLADNIYTRSAAGAEKLAGDPIMGSPSNPGDCVMLPVAGYRPRGNAK